MGIEERDEGLVLRQNGTAVQLEDAPETIDQVDPGPDGLTDEEPVLDTLHVEPVDSAAVQVAVESAQVDKRAIREQLADHPLDDVADLQTCSRSVEGVRLERRAVQRQESGVRIAMSDHGV